MALRRCPASPAGRTRCNGPGATDPVRDGYADAVALHEAADAHRLGQIRIRGGEAFLHRAVVAGQPFGVERARQIEIQEPRQVEISECGAAHGSRVEGRVPVMPVVVVRAKDSGGQRLRELRGAGRGRCPEGKARKPSGDRRGR